MRDISIVVPIFKEGYYLEKTLRSLANQTWIGRTEIVLAEYNPDNSSYTKNILTKFHEDYIEIPVRLIQVNQTGIAFARHQGIMHSKGDIVLNFDADARFSNTEGLKMMTEPIFNQEAVLTVCESQMDLTEFPEGSLQAIENSQAMMSWFNTLQNVGWPVFEAGSAINRSVYEEIGGFADVKQGEMMQLAIRLVWKYPGKHKLVNGVQVIQSARRLIKLEEFSKAGRINDLTKIADYEYAVRKDRVMPVE